MKKILFYTLIFIFGIVNAQDLVLIQFADKPSADIYFDDPTLMLSQKALDRRAKYNIDLDIKDVPVETTYIDEVEDLGIEPIQISKWFNGVFAWCTEDQILQLENLNFVEEVKSFVRNEEPNFAKNQIENDWEYTFEAVESNLPNTNYGYTATQINQIKLEHLHDLGFTGEGISIAVLDNGFLGVDTANGFSYIRNNNQIKGVYNFIYDNEDVYSQGTHGTVVLSTIAGFIENQYVGTAIDADFYLFVTEDNSHEMPDEEVHWLAAAEWADYLGVDVINTSLGYNNYDDSRYDYETSNLDGQTSYISRAAQIASDKGIMVVVSAGNSGNKQWHYITMPADAEGVFTIGAVDANGNPTSFSSYGPTADGRIKPDVMALGGNAVVIRYDGQIGYSNGTSLSSPIIAGAMACLIQAFPEYQPSYLREKVRESASLYENPENQMGYGIPDFSWAYDACLGVLDVDEQKVIIYPNPTYDSVEILSKIAIKNIELFTINGQKVREFKVDSKLDLTDLSKGIYVLNIQLFDGKKVSKKIIKK